MIDSATLLVFAAACLALTITPGPDMLLVVSRSVSQGKSAGFASLVGVQLGTYVHAVAAALGLTQLMAAFPAAYDIIRYAGAAYLLWLAWQAFTAADPFARPTSESGRHSTLAILGQGLVTNILNPKMALFVLSLFPQFVRLDSEPVLVQFLVLATVLNAIDMIVNGTMIFAAGSLNGLLTRGGRYARLPSLLMGTVFVGLAARLACDGRR